MSRLLAKLQRNSPPCDYRKASEDSVSHFSIAETSGDATVDLPPGVHAVLAPYKLRRKNSNIICDFLVFDGGSTDTYTPDIELRTKNALLDSAVYIDSQDWGRPVSIHARTKNSDLILGIHTLQADQAVSVRARAKNGRSRLFLPRDFKGLLAVSTKNGKCTLSAALKKVAVRVPSRYEEMLWDDKLTACREPSGRIKIDVAKQVSSGVDVWYEVNGGGPSVAFVDTKNGNVWTGFSRDDEASCWPSCSVM